MVRKRVARSLDRYIDSKNEQIILVIARNVEVVRQTLGDRLPDLIIGLLTKHFGEEDEEISFFSKIVIRLAESLPDRFKEDVGDAVRQDVDKAVEGVTEFISIEVLKDMKRAVAELAGSGGHRKSRSVDTSANATREVTDRGISSFFKRKDDSSEDDAVVSDDGGETGVLENIDLSFLFHGKDGLVQQIITLIRPTIHRAGEDIMRRLNTVFPGHVRELVVRDVDDDGMVQRKRDKFLQIFKHDLSESSLLTKLFTKLPNKVESKVRPYIETFEQTLLENLSVEFHEIFREGSSIREFFRKLKK